MAIKLWAWLQFCSLTIWWAGIQSRPTSNTAHTSTKRITQSQVETRNTKNGADGETKLSALEQALANPMGDVATTPPIFTSRNSEPSAR